MGLRAAPYIAQRITNAIAFIHRQLQFFLLNYVDDFVGAELLDKIWQSFDALTNLLDTLNMETSQDKIVTSTTRLEFLGITFDSNKMTMEISQQKLEEIKRELDTWQLRMSANRKEVESLVGKLQFAAKCIRPGRIFLGRLLKWIRSMKRGKKTAVPLEARKDIAWWSRCIHQYNGISLMWLHKEPNTDTILQTDACPKDYGGICGDEYFRGRFPVQMQTYNIAVLEMWAVLVGLKLWAEKLSGKYFWIHVDNEAVASVLNSGASRHEQLQDALREIVLIVSKAQFVIKARHIPGVDNRIPDWLSRWDDPTSRRKFREWSRDKSIKHRRVSNSFLTYDNEW